MKPIMTPAGTKGERVYNRPLTNVGKRLPYELVLEALAICSLNPAFIIGVSGLIFVDITQAFVRTFKNLE